jgi:acetoin utilization protein AcuB
MLVAEIMTYDPMTILPGATVSDALDIMNTQEFHQLPVVSTSGHVIGMVTRRDCQRLNGASGSAYYVRDVMQPAPIIVEPRTTVHEAARLMTAHHIRALPVMRGESLVGILTATDLLIAFMHTLQKYEEVEPSLGMI